MKIIFIVFTVNFFIQQMLGNSLEILNLSIGGVNNIVAGSSVINYNSFNVVSNPAVLVLNKNLKEDYILEYNKLLYFAGTSYDSVGFQITRSNIGLTISKFSSGNIEVKDIDGVPTGETFEYTTTIVNVGFSTLLNSFDKNNNLYLGGSGYIIWEKLNLEKRSYAANIGVLYNCLLEKNKLVKAVYIGAVIKGVGITKNLVYYSDVSINTETLSIILGYENRIGGLNTGKVKTGFIFKVLPDLAIGGGYCFTENRLSNLLTGSVSLKIKDVILGYTITIHECLGNTHSIQLSLML